MPKVDKPVLGTRQCPDCGEGGSIHLAAGKRGSLYQRCGCGCRQENGRMMQSRFYYEADWRPDCKPAAPANVYPLEEYREKLAALHERNRAAVGQPDRESQQSREVAPVSETGNEPVTKPDFIPEEKPEAEPENSKKGLIWLGAGLGLIAAIVGAA